MAKKYTVTKLGQGKIMVLSGDVITLNDETTQAKLKKVFKHQQKRTFVIESDAKENSENDKD